MNTNDAGPDGFDLTEDQMRELDRRLDDQQVNPGIGRPWREVVARLLTEEGGRSEGV